MFSDFSRRRILKMVLGLVSGATIIGSLSLTRKLFAEDAQAQERSNRIKERIINYKGKEIRIGSLNKTTQQTNLPYDPVPLYIDGELIDVIRYKKTGIYQTYLLPFEDYGSPDKIAKDIIDRKIKVPKPKKQNTRRRKGAIQF
jgi:hypothetical protein